MTLPMNQDTGKKDRNEQMVLHHPVKKKWKDSL